MAPPLDIARHVRYIQELDTVRLGRSRLGRHSANNNRRVIPQKKDDLAYHLTEHLRLNGVYWGLVALFVMGQPGALDREEMIAYVMSCWDDGSGGSPGGRALDTGLMLDE